MNKIINFPACTYKSHNFVQSQPNFAPTHDSETLTVETMITQIIRTTYQVRLARLSSLLNAFAQPFSLILDSLNRYYLIYDWLKNYINLSGLRGFLPSGEGGGVCYQRS